MNIKKVLNNGVEKIKNGFTLVELLIVIGILALLASVVIVALNPIQNLAKTRDAGRLSTIDQIGHSLESYATSSGTGKYVDPAATCAGAGGVANDGTAWLTCLTTAGSGDLNSAPSLVANTLTAKCAGVSLGSTGGSQNGWCYKVANTGGVAGAGPMIVYSRLEASANIAKCPIPASDFAYAVYSSADGKSGVVCAASEAALATGTQTFR